MKKTILSIAFVAFGMFALTASAQQPVKAKTECQEQCCKEQKAPNARQHAPRVNPLEGITLTAEQEAAVKALNEKTFSAHKEAREKKGEEAKKAREAGRDGRKEYLAEMKKILTPEQYVTYLENLATQKQMQQRPGKDMHKGKKGEKHVKGNKDGKKVRPEKKDK